MDRDLQILVSTPRQLIVENPRESRSAVVLFFELGTLCLIAYSIYRLWRVSKLWSLGLIVITLLVAWLVSGSQRTVYRLAIDRQQGSVIYETRLGDDVTSRHAALADIDSAQIEYNRGSRRIALIQHDGKEIFPLGPEWQYEDSQFKVLDLIRGFIRPIAPAASEGSAHP